MTPRGRALLVSVSLVTLAGVALTAWLGTPPPPPAAATAAPPTASVNDTAPALIIEDPAALAALEAAGFALGPLAFGAAAATARELADTDGWRTIVSTLEADLKDLYAKDRSYGVGMRFTHRGFDLSWLVSPAVRFELSAVVNRVDRKDFMREGCGEIRFIYRAAYTIDVKETPFSSRLPMTINVVHFLHPAGDATCAVAARALERLRTDGWGVLGPKKSVEINLQTVRWPSTIRPDLGGHADYVLRVFEPDSTGQLGPAPLENTPDVMLLQSDSALADEFREWLRSSETARAAQIGVVDMPDRFATRRAVSVTPRGMARLQNRPFLAAARALRIDDVAAETLRLLDGTSCMGCHQSRSVAGFHILGAERDAARTVDALAIAHSPHVDDELTRRGRAVAAILDGPGGGVWDPQRAAPERGAPAQGHGAEGVACGRQMFASWACAEGFTCLEVDEPDVGQCAPKSPGIGGACRPGHVDLVRDRITHSGELPCPDDAVCEGIGVGFPGGMCAGSCDTKRPASDRARCGGIALLTPFNDCLARGGLFSDCAKHQRPAALQACSETAPCRPDYLCARTETGEGACLPPYFVLQMRVDGHPLTPEPRWRALLGHAR